MNFEDYFVALQFHPQLRRWECHPQPAQIVPISLHLNTVYHPPEGLLNRLRDVSTVRKISHRLPLKFYHYFTHECEHRYLAPIARFGFDHPDLNPFFFYNKDATVLLNGGDDQQRIEAICRQVAQETESIITLNP